MTSDKKTIGISASNASALASLVVAGNFLSELDAAKFAMAYSIKSGVKSGTTEGAETKWNVGSMDPDGALRLLLEALYPDTVEPYRLGEHLINEGLKLIASTGSGEIDMYETLFAL